MKIRSSRLAILVAAAALTSPVHSAVSILDPAYSFSNYHTDSEPTSSVVAFDWELEGALYYQTFTTSYNFGGLFKWNGLTQTTAVPGDSDFYGYSVLRVDGQLYYNTSTSSSQKISRYDPLNTPLSPVQVSAANNSFLFSRQPGEIFITGAEGFGTNQNYRAQLDAAGDFLSAPISLGLTIGNSGPGRFDASGNMFYAPGFGDLSIYRYTAADVAAAIDDPAANPLPPAASRLWWNYGTDFPAVSGATGLAFDASGNLLVTLTDFSNPSYLVLANVDGSGSFSSFSPLLSSTEQLFAVQFKDDAIYVANSNTILQVVPEPSTCGLLLLGGVVLAWVRSRRRKAGRAAQESAP